MTDFDKRLIEKADSISRWHWNDIAVLIDIADTEAARKRLRNIQWELRELAEESL